MAECVALAKEVAADVAERFGVPVYLYEEASRNPARRNLEDIRRGEFEGLAAKMASPGWAPDYGPRRRTRGPAPRSSARGMPLIAYNINLQHRSARRGEGDRRGRCGTAAAACAS